MSPAKFATPLPQPIRSEVLEWRLPKPYSHLVLTGKSFAAWHTSFVIPQLNLLLDAGLCVNSLRPKHVFLTHGHRDHTLLSPTFTKREDNPDIYCPEEMAKAFDSYILASTMLNLGGLVELGGSDEGHEGHEGVEGAESETSGEDGGVQKKEDLKNSIKKPPSPLSTSGNKAHGQKPGLSGATQVGSSNYWLNTHITHGLRAGDVVELPRMKNVIATAFACDHTVPCLGYVFSTLSQRLMPTYVGRPGPELARLKKDGVCITEQHNKLMFAFLGDTTAGTLAAEPDWLKDGIPVVISECSFLFSEHKAQADKTKHTIWQDLEPVVRKFPKTTFVLTHFSLRYKQKDIRDFFNGLEDCPENIVVWVDGEE